MRWIILFHDEFDAEFSAFRRNVQTARLLESFCPQLGRPHVDTLKDSKYAHMKELRFDAADGVWPLPSILTGKPFFSLP